MGLPTSLGDVPEWTMYRLRRRLPKLMARLERELPLVSVADLYTTVPDQGWRIPSTVYQTWSEARLGRSHRASLARLRQRNSDFSFALYDDAMIDRYMAAHWSNHPIHRIYTAAMFGPVKTDIWRYCILHERGGVYIDISKSIETPLRDLITADCGAVVSWEGKRPPEPASDAARAALLCPDDVVINWALLFAPGHPVLGRAIDGIVAHYPEYKDRIQDHPKEAILNFTGPHHLTRCLWAAAEADEIGDVRQVPVNFDGAVDWYVPGSWVRYATMPPYEIARDRAIVR